jgi:hypothetical protein
MTAELRTRSDWKSLRRIVPTKAVPAKKEFYYVPGYMRVTRIRHLFSLDQTVEVSREQSAKRLLVAKLGKETRENNRVDRMQTVKLTIVNGMTDADIYDLASCTHGGRYAGELGEGRLSAKQARDTIRTKLTNYESLRPRITRRQTDNRAYAVLRTRIDALVDETYPQYAPGTNAIPAGATN